MERFIKNIDTPYICDADKPNPQNYLKAVEMLNIKKRRGSGYRGSGIYRYSGSKTEVILPVFLLRFIRQDDEKWIGKRRYVEYAILECWKRDKSCYRRIGDIYTEGTAKNMKKKKEKKLFVRSVRLHMKFQSQKRYVKRHIQDFAGKEKFSTVKQKEKLPNLVFSYNSGLIKKEKGIDPVLSENKARNIRLASSRINGMIIHPGETFRSGGL